VIPAALSFLTVSRKAVHVVGGSETPALANSALLYQKPTMPMSNGTA
jgi:hypothetical protein